MNVGQRIREAREDLGMPQTVLARRVGVNRNTIGRYESGEHEPSFAMLESIARELRTEPAEFLREPVPLAEAPPPSGPHGRNSAESSSPRQQLYERRIAGPARIATLERTFQHLTLRTNSLRDQAKPYYEAGDREGLQSVWMDYFLLARGADS